MTRGYTAHYWPETVAGEPGFSYECMFHGRVVFEGWSRGKKRDAQADVERGITNREALIALTAGKAA